MIFPFGIDVSVGEGGIVVGVDASDGIGAIFVGDCVSSVTVGDDAVPQAFNRNERTVTRRIDFMTCLIVPSD